MRTARRAAASIQVGYVDLLPVIAMEDGFVVECRICDWRESAATFADAVEVGDAHDLTHRRWFPRWWQRLFPR